MSKSVTTEVFLPQNLPFPIKVVSLDSASSTAVTRGTRLLTYSWVHDVHPQDPAEPSTSELRFGTWDTTIEGTITSWKVKKDDQISKEWAQRKPAVEILEPCRHVMHFGGMCTECGHDMTHVDYTGFSDANRATIAMTHHANGPLVALEEAQRLERESADQMLKARKLYLIVDLDQTIVHAAVDPTIGEWIAEGQAWEAREKTDDDEDEGNPNWEALKDVKQFKLAPESFGPPGLRAAYKGKKAVETEGCTYYFKPRPGWDDFLHHAARNYEMHVYTMGTRAYAEGVLAAIDPDSRLFGGRVLSRDESGSLTQKNLSRLFPCDQSMVVIIDDRADVWEWSPNLIKVIPYTFFPSIGDINSAFLPKVEPTTAKEVVGRLTPGGVDTTPVITAPEDEVENKELQTTALQNAVLDAQLTERPLAKKEKELQEQEAEETEVGESPPNDSVTEDAKEKSPKREKMHRKAFLNNDDWELIRVGEFLNDVHTRFYEAYDTRKKKSDSQNGKTKKMYKAIKLHDVTRIIPQIREEVFKGVHIVFSGIIPLDARPETVEAWKLAHMFGARCSTQLSKGVTHVVAKNRTAKVQEAFKLGRIHVVNENWFNHSVALWRRQKEKNFPVPLDDPQPSTSATTAPSKSNQSGSSQVEPKAKKKTANTTPDTPNSSTGTIDKTDASANTINRPDPSTSSTADKAEDTTADVSRDSPATTTEAANADTPTEQTGTPPPEVIPGSNSEAGTDWTMGTNPESATSTTAAAATAAMNGKPFDVAAEKMEFDLTISIGDDMLETINWATVNDEVEEMMGESDDEFDTKSQRSGMGSDDGWTSENSSRKSSKVKFRLPEDDETSENGSPHLKRKRHGSTTPPDSGSVTNRDDELLKSPLAKRKKLAAERAGASRLKEEHSLDASEPPSSSPSRPEFSPKDARLDEEDDEDEEEETEYDDDEDFLAGMLAMEGEES